jgi:hypothetical protein
MGKYFIANLRRLKNEAKQAEQEYLTHLIADSGASRPPIPR